MSIFVYIFAAKLDTKNDINKQMEQIFNSLAPEGYFANLTKKEKGKFLRYLMVSKRIRDAAFFLIIMLVTFAATLLNPQKYVSSRTIQKCVEHVSTST